LLLSVVCLPLAGSKLEEWISIITSGRAEGHPINGNKQNCHITRYRLTTGKRPILSQCDKDFEDLVLNELRYRDVKRS